MRKGIVRSSIKREIDRVDEILDHIETADAVRHGVFNALADFYDVLDGLPDTMKKQGLDQPVIDRLCSNVEAAKEMVRGPAHQKNRS